MKRRIAVLLAVGAVLIAAAAAIASQASGGTPNTKEAKIYRQINQTAQARALLRCKAHDRRLECRQLLKRIERLAGEVK